MPWWILEIATNAVLIGIALWLGPFIKRFGRAYAADVFHDNPLTGKSYIVLTDIVYYLIFSAYILFTVRVEAPSYFGGDVHADPAEGRAGADRRDPADHRRAARPQHRDHADPRASVLAQPAAPAETGGVTTFALHDAAAAAEHADGVWRLYDAVFGDFSSRESWEEELWNRHRGRDGFRLATAYDDGTLLGFGWSYVGEHGQYWPDLGGAHPAARGDRGVGGRPPGGRRAGGRCGRSRTGCRRWAARPDDGVARPAPGSARHVRRRRRPCCSAVPVSRLGADRAALRRRAGDGPGGFCHEGGVALARLTVCVAP